MKQSKEKPRIMVYALSTCPWCMKTKQFLRDHKIAFNFVDYDLADEKQQEKIIEELDKLDANSGFPVIIIGTEVIIGYQPEKISKVLGLKK
jgi:glutaredoxin